MTPAELLRRLTRLARRRGVDLVVTDGSNHTKVVFGQRRTVVPRHKADLAAGTYRAICRQLGVSREEMEE